MNKNFSQSGLEIAESLYGNGSGVFQVRNLEGRKVAEFEHEQETKHFLRGRDSGKYEVWHLESTPGALIGIYSGPTFINQ